MHPSSTSPSPHRPTALKRKWCTPDLEGLKPGGPRSTGRSFDRSSGPRSTGRPSKRLGQQQWCTVTIDEDDEVGSEMQHDWRQLNAESNDEDHPDPDALPARME